MGDCVSKDDCTHLCDDEYGARFQQPAPFDPKTGFTFATPAEGTKLAWGIQPYYTYYRPTIDARQTQRSRSLTPGPPRVPAVPLAGQLPSDTADSRASGTSSSSSSSTNGGGCSSEPFGSDSTPPRDARLHNQLDNNLTTVGGGGGSGHSSGSNGAGGSTGTSSAVVMSSGGEAPTASTSPPAAQKGVEGDDGTANNTAYARSVRVIGSSNYVHLMAFTAQSVVPAVDGPVLRLTVRNECHASMAIGVVPLAHAAELYGPNRYLYDWRSHDVCGGGVTLWARDQATPFGIFDFGSPKERNQADLHGMCVKGSFVTLELDVATRVVRLSVRPGEASVKDGTDGGATTVGGGALDRAARRVREIVGTIRPNTIGLDTPLVFVVAPMCSGDVVTIVPSSEC